MIAGLTGGIGSGKSRTLQIFAGLGWETFDADVIARTVIEENRQRIHEEVYERWGFFFDRAKVAEKIFSNPLERDWYNGLMHPLIASVLEKGLMGIRWGMVEIPLLFEADWVKKFDVSIAVWTPEKIVRERLLKRGWDDSHITARLASQLNADEKLRRADYGLINDADEANLFEQCVRLNQLLRQHLRHG